MGILSFTWTEVITASFENGMFDYAKYIDVYEKAIRLPPKGARILECTSFYPVSLLVGCLDKKTENAYIEHIINNNDGIYYIYDRKISILPEEFQSKKSSRFLAAIELLSEYEVSKRKLLYVVNWLWQNRNASGKWDMGNIVNDKVYFPLSDSWRNAKIREDDCTERIIRILDKLK